MSRKHIAEKIRRSLPDGFSVSKGIIYQTSYRHIVFGVLIDGTPYKETWRILSFMYPLFRTAPFIHIEYCRRLRHPDTSGPDPFTGGSDFFSGSDETIAADALRAVHQAGLIEAIAGGCSPAQFLQRHDIRRLEDARAFRAFEVACAAGLCGDIDRARRGLKAARETTIELATRSGPYRDHDAFLHDVEIGLQMLDEGSAAFQAHMDREAQAAAAFHGFCPPSIGPDPPVRS